MIKSDSDGQKIDSYMIKSDSNGHNEKSEPKEIKGIKINKDSHEAKRIDSNNKKIDSYTLKSDSKGYIKKRHIASQKIKSDSNGHILNVESNGELQSNDKSTDKC